MSARGLSTLRAHRLVSLAALLAVAMALPVGPGSLEQVVRAQDPSQEGFSTAGWRTDFGITSVPLSEISAGGPPRDGIPAIDQPVFEPIEAAREWLAPAAPVIALDVDDDVRAYPLAILVWHEIVNDVVGGRPVVVTFCPLCNTALIFDRGLAGVTYDFGTTGNLRFSDLIMYDRQTETWWQQATGQAIVGELVGSRLAFRVGQLISLEQFAEAWPDGEVLSRDTGHDHRYAAGSYVGHDTNDGSLVLYAGEPIGGISPKERVVTLGEGSDGIAFPHSLLRLAGVASETVEGEPVVVFWEPRVARLSGDLIIDDDQGVGSTGVFSPVVDGRALAFVRSGVAGAPIVDAQTNSTWTITGRAVDGPLSGTQLQPVAHADHFWFAWAAFVPQTRIWTPEGTVRPDLAD
jgi:hypothetical protein